MDVNSADDTPKTPSVSEADLIGELRSLYSALTKNFPGFSPRESQRRMIYLAARTFASLEGDRRYALIEAPTGTGKGLAYLTAAMAVRRITEQTLLVSTDTVVLQDQLIKKDIPAFLRAIGEPGHSYSVAKGAARYLCLHKAEDLIAESKGTADLFGGAALNGQLWPRAPRAGEVERIAKTIDDVSRGRKEGCLDSLRSIREDIKPAVGVSQASCIGSHCSHFKHCPLRMARARAKEGGIVVMNHNLLFSYLTGGQGWVPFAEPADSLLVLDEAHNLPGVARSALAGSIYPRGLKTLSERLGTLVDSTPRALHAQEDIAEILSKIPTVAAQIATVSEHLKMVLDQFPSEQRLDPVEPVPTALAKTVEELGVLGPAAEALGSLRRRLTAIANDRQTGGRQLSAQALMMLSAVGNLSSQLDHPLRALKLITRHEPDRFPVAIWSVQHKNGQSLHAAPTESGPVIRSSLWSKIDRAVLTSATLRSVGDFRQVTAETGAGRDAITLALASPFDLKRVSIVYPQSGVKPRTPEHDQRVLAAARALADKALKERTGGLILTPSWTELKAIREDLKTRYPDRVLAQGQSTKEALLKRHCKRVGAGEGSVLLGTASFSEGIDLPGEFCTLILITKLPFSVPDDPVQWARSRVVEHRGRSPFMELSLPEASMSLTQAVGRMARTAMDRGVVMILDDRLHTKRYGSLLLKGLNAHQLVACTGPKAMIEQFSQGRWDGKTAAPAPIRGAA